MVIPDMSTSIGNVTYHRRDFTLIRKGYFIIMGLNSYILAIGKYKNMPKDILDYPQDFYEDVADDTIVFGTIGECNTSGESRDLSEIAGCNCWDFNTHHITKIPGEEDITFWNIDMSHYRKQLQRCLDNGIDLYFQPNG